GGRSRNRRRASAPRPAPGAGRAAAPARARQPLKALPEALPGQAASARAVAAALAKARYAHLATHGFYATDETLRDARLDPSLFERGRFDRQAGARSPLARCRLVLAAHNLQGAQAAPARGLPTAD